MKQSVGKLLFTYVALLAVMLVAAMARFRYGLAPFGFGIFAAMLWANQSLLMICPIYLLAMLLTDFSTATIVVAGTTVAVSALAKTVCSVRKKRLRKPLAVLCATSGQFCGFAFCRGLGAVAVGLNVLLGAAFCFAAINTVSAVRRCRRYLTRTEQGGIAVLCFALGAELISASIAGISPFFLAYCFFVPLGAVAFNKRALPFAVIAALGAVCAAEQLVYLIPAAVIVAASVFVNGKPVPLAVITAASEVICGYFAGVSHYNFLLAFVGAAAFLLLPREAKSRFAVMGTTSGNAVKATVNKSRLDISGRIGSISEGLKTLAASLIAVSREKDATDNKMRVCNIVADKLCNGCKGAKDCAMEAGGNTAALFYDPVSHAVDTGRVSIVDVPQYVASNCHKVREVLDEIEDTAIKVREETAVANRRNAERRCFAEQVQGVSGVLERLGGEMRRTVSFDAERERRIMDELAVSGVPVGDAIVAEDAGGVSVTLTMREKDAENKRITRAVQKVLGVPVIKQSIGMQGGGMVSVNLVNAPCYDVIVGEAAAVKDGSGESGDSKSVVRLGGDKVMVALCDGMGSGESAANGSAAAISLVENFYKTGVDGQVLLPLINRLLFVQNDGSFQTLDMCVINLNSGETDFIKLCAPESVVKRKDKIEVIEGGALPLGILDEVVPHISRCRLKSGDTVVLATDGVTDVIGADGVVRVLEQTGTNNPQTVAEAVLSDAMCVSCKDDKTVVAVRLFRRLD